MKTLLYDGLIISLLRPRSQGCDRRFRLILCIVPSSFKKYNGEAKQNKTLPIQPLMMSDGAHAHAEEEEARKQSSVRSSNLSNALKKNNLLYKLLVWSRKFRLKNIPMFLFGKYCR